MTLVRSDAGRQVFRFAPVDLGLLLRRLVEDAERLAAPKKIRLEVGQIDEIPFQGDEARLRQLFLNLLENAVKYTPARGTVTVSLVREPHTALFTVLDTGIGIPPKDLDHIFERFYRVERTVGKEVPGGSGLGLAIAKWVAEAHKGTIEAKSREGRGSTFVVRLPIP
jgi:signal transduction histidine kinase